ncbi:MAG TPA: ribose-phosphate pyrophosphokinase [Pirellulales bacterium]
MKDLKIFSGRANPELSRDICGYLGIELGKVDTLDFADGETFCKINEDIRGRDVFIVQPTCCPVNDRLMELLIMVDCAMRASADRITAVIPYFGYARQDRKDSGRVPISAKLVANMISRAGADRVLTMDLHAAQIQGFFDCPVDHLYAAPVLDDYFASLNLDPATLAVISPDEGRIKPAMKHLQRLGGVLAVIDKRRKNDTLTEQANIIGGPVEGKTCLMFDDMISTAGSICGAANICKRFGAREIYVAATHGVFAGNALQRLAEAPIREVVVTNTIPLPKNCHLPNIKVLSVAALIGEAIKRIHLHQSVSHLFASEW